MVPLNAVQFARLIQVGDRDSAQACLKATTNLGAQNLVKDVRESSKQETHCEGIVQSFGFRETASYTFLRVCLKLNS